MNTYFSFSADAPIAGLGIAIALVAERQLHRAGTTVETFGSPVSLVVTGAFSRSRNPIYLGITVFLAGIALMLNQVYGLMAAGFFLLACNFGYIPHEEKRMIEKFILNYRDYTNKVRRWI